MNSRLDPESAAQQGKDADVTGRVVGLPARLPLPRGAPALPIHGRTCLGESVYMSTVDLRSLRDICGDSSDIDLRTNIDLRILMALISFPTQVLASFGKSLGVRRLYVRTLIRIFEVIIDV